MGKAEDVLRARQADAAAQLAAETNIVAERDRAQVRALHEDVGSLIERALLALKEAGYSGGLLLDVEDLDHKIGFASRRRYACDQTAAWLIFDDGYTSADGDRFSSPVYLASNGKLIITRGHDPSHSRLSRAGHYYLALDRLDWNRTIDRQIHFLEKVREGLISLIQVGR